MPLAGPSLSSSAQSSGPHWHINMCFMRRHAKTALQGQPEQKPAGTSLYFSWMPLKPEQAQECTCPYQAVQGTGSGEEGSQAGACLLIHYYWAQSVREVLPSAPGSYQGRSFLCVASILAGIHKMTVITWKPEWSKQTNNPQLKQPLQNNRENLSLWFLEQGLIMQVHQSSCVTLKALGWFLRPSTCWSKTNRTQPTTAMFMGNHEITKRTGEVYTVKALSTAIT